MKVKEIIQEREQKQFEKSVTEGPLEFRTPNPVVVIQDLKGKMLDKLNLSVAAQKYNLGQPRDIKKQLAHQNYTTIGDYVIIAPMSGQPQDKTTQGVAERVRDPEDWDEGNTEPPNNFAIYINGKKWKVFKGRGQFADDYKEIQHFRQLQNWAQQKSAQTGKKWEVARTGEEATESISETATAGATSSGNVSVGAVYKNKPGKTAKNKDGTAKNALDMKGTNLLTGGSIKR
jgi:hypothetical protein